MSEFQGDATAIYEIPTFVSFIQGTQLVRKKETFLSAFLSSIVELGASPQASEISEHILPTVPVAVTRSMLRLLENAGLVVIDGDEATLTDAGVESLTSERVPISDVGNWRVVWTRFKGAIQIVDCTRDAIGGFQLSNALYEVRHDQNEAERQLKARRRVVSGEVFKNWSSPLADISIEVLFPDVADHIDSVSMSESITISISRNSNIWSFQFEEDEKHLSRDRSQWMAHLIDDCQTAMTRIPSKIDFSRADDVTVTTLNSKGSLMEHQVVGDGVVRRELSWGSSPITLQVDEICDWLAHFVIASTSDYLTVDVIRSIIDDGLALLQSPPDLDVHNVIQQTLSCLEMRSDRYSDRWWFVMAPSDWGLL